jgi:hypothetical protein
MSTLASLPARFRMTVPMTTGLIITVKASIARENGAVASNATSVARET